MDIQEVAIIVPFYKADLNTIIQFIQSVNKQSYPLDKIWLYLVDNNEIQNNEISFLIDDNIKFSLLHTLEPGSYSARNFALKVIKQEIVLFTDIDCILNNHWVENAVAALRRYGKNAIIGGKIQFLFRSSKISLIEDFDRRTHLRQKYYVKNGFCATANLGAYLEAFNNVGFFDSSVLSGSDESWCREAVKKGYKIYYASEAIVYHPARASLLKLIIKNRRGCGAYYIKEKSKNHYAVVSGPLYELSNMKKRWERLWEREFKTNLNRKCGLFLIFLIIEIVRIGEYIRIFCGGNPERR